MTVKEIVDSLREFPDDTIICIDCPDCGVMCIIDIEDDGDDGIVIFVSS